MHKAKREAIEAAGHYVGDIEDFLGLSDVERKEVALRIDLARAVRRRREGSQLTQAQLARRMKSSQSRVAKIEAGASGVTLDLMIHGLFAAGGEISDLIGKVGQSAATTISGHKAGARAAAATKAGRKKAPRR
jgi:transcriptional regulator with XRE-family HTH domain